MNATPIQPDSNEREELARLLPGPVERDLPSGRHRQLQEFVMSQIHQDLQQADRAPRRSPRRPALLASVLTAGVAAAAAAVMIGTSGPGGSGGSGGSAMHAAVPLSGQQVLLAAATTAERTPEGSGTYWYVKTVTADKGGKNQWETWTRRDGQTWSRGVKSGGKVVKLVRPVPFRLGGPDVSFAQLRNLPTGPDALKAWIADGVKHSDVRTSAGRPDATMQKQMVFDGLVSLVSALPALPKVRSAAFRAIASYPNVKSIGTVKGGQGLLISFPKGKPERLVVDPATSRVSETNYLVTADGAELVAPAGGGATIVAEWTNTLPS